MNLETRWKFDPGGLQLLPSRFFFFNLFSYKCHFHSAKKYPLSLTFPTYLIFTHARWLEEHLQISCELRAIVQEHFPEKELRLFVENCLAHYDEVMNLKSMVAKTFYLVSGMRNTAAERCFRWMGGFNPSELIKIILNQIEPLTEQQILGIRGLQQSTQEVGEALSQGLNALNQSLVDTVTADSLNIPYTIEDSRGRVVVRSFQGHIGDVDGKPSDALFNHPKGITMDDKGNVYVADIVNLAIRKIGDVDVTTIAGGKSNVEGYRDGPSEDAKFSNDFDVVYVRPICSLLVIDRGNASLRQVSLNQEDSDY